MRRRVRDSNPRRCDPRRVSNPRALPTANPPCAPRTGLEPVVSAVTRRRPLLLDQQGMNRLSPWTRPDSNRPPPACGAGALPNELRARRFVCRVPGAGLEPATHRVLAGGLFPWATRAWWTTSVSNRAGAACKAALHTCASPLTSSEGRAAGGHRTRFPGLEDRCVRRVHHDRIDGTQISLPWS